MAFSRPKRVRSRAAWAIAQAAAGGGGAGGNGWERLTGAKCVDHHSAGAACGYSSPANFTLTESGGVTQLRYVAGVNFGSQPANGLNRLSILWHDTGIKFEDIASIETYCKQTGIAGNPNGPNKEPIYGIVISGTYLTPTAQPAYPAPEHYLAIGRYSDNGSNDYRFVALNDETYAGAGAAANQYPIGYCTIPIHTQDNTSRFTTRDVNLRSLRVNNDVNVFAALKDLSTWQNLNRWWNPTDTLKIGIFIGIKKLYGTLNAGEGFDFDMRYRINQGRI